MANKKISQLIPTTTLTDNAMFVVAEDNTNKFILLQDLKLLMGGGLVNGATVGDVEIPIEEKILKFPYYNVVADDSSIIIPEPVTPFDIEEYVNNAILNSDDTINTVREQTELTNEHRLQAQYNIGIRVLSQSDYDTLSLDVQKSLIAYILEGDKIVKLYVNGYPTTTEVLTSSFTSGFSLGFGNK